MARQRPAGARRSTISSCLAIALALPNAVLLLRTTRTSMLEVLSGDYIRTARAKGLSPWVVVARHALRNALVPILTVVGLAAAFMIGSTTVTETVFGLPGVGQLVVAAVLSATIR